MPNIFHRSIIVSLLLLAHPCIGRLQAEESKPIFDLDCISFEGRFMAGAPLKKKLYPGLAVDGTSWALSPDQKHVTIARVFSGEAAEKAGVEVGDLVTKVNGYPVDGLSLRDIFCAYHMYQPDTLTETLMIQKKDGASKTLTLQMLNLDKCDQEEKRVWLDTYKSLGY